MCCIQFFTGVCLPTYASFQPPNHITCSINPGFSSLIMTTGHNGYVYLSLAEKIVMDNKLFLLT